MKIGNLKIFKTLIAAVLLIAIIAALLSLFVFDKNKNQLYQPTIEHAFLQKQVDRLLPIPEETSDEVILNNKGFKGILVYGCKSSTSDEIVKYFEYLSSNEYDGKYIKFKDNLSGIYVGAARYTPIVKALGYGWWDYSGNLYAKLYGDDKAADKTNYRNYFYFVIHKNNYLYTFRIFCNSDNSEKALSHAIDYITELSE